MAWCHQAASHYLSQRRPDSWNAASLGHIGLIPSQWFGILEDIWNHRCKPVSYMLTDMHIRIRTIIVSNMIWNTCTTGHSITLWVKRSEFKHRCVFAGVHIHTYIHTYIVNIHIHICIPISYHYDLEYMHYKVSISLCGWKKLRFDTRISECYEYLQVISWIIILALIFI